MTTIRRSPDGFKLRTPSRAAALDCVGGNCLSLDAIVVEITGPGTIHCLPVDYCTYPVCDVGGWPARGFPAFHAEIQDLLTGGVLPARCSYGPEQRPICCYALRTGAMEGVRREPTLLPFCPETPYPPTCPDGGGGGSPCERVCQCDPATENKRAGITATVQRDAFDFVDVSLSSWYMLYQRAHGCCETPDATNFVDSWTHTYTQRMFISTFTTAAERIPWARFMAGDPCIMQRYNPGPPACGPQQSESCDPPFPFLGPLAGDVTITVRRLMP